MTAPAIELPTLTRPQRFISPAGFGFQPIKYKKDNGSFVVEREAVFRSGTFRDMMGIQSTFEPIHIDQMKSNFDYLRSTGLWAEIPARDGHAGFLISNMEGNGRVVGWHTGIEIEELQSPVDGEKYTYVLASYEITEPDAADKVARGTWRNRSAEVYRWVTNNEAEFWPVYGGFAFVDIPAVEGLNFSRDPSGAPANGARYFVMREMTVTSPAPGIPAQQPGTAPSQTAQATPPVPALPTPGVQQHAAPAAQQHMFTINGQATNDYAAVQRHITSLENAVTESTNAARAGFVNALAQNGMIVGSEENLRSMTQFAQSLTAEQFEQWSAGYAGAQPQALFGQHGGQATGPVTVTGQTPASAVSDEIEIAKQTVGYQRSFMSEEDVRKTPSFAKLVAAGIEK